MPLGEPREDGGGGGGERRRRRRKGWATAREGGREGEGRKYVGVGRREKE